MFPEQTLFLKELPSSVLYLHYEQSPIDHPPRDFCSISKTKANKSPNVVIIKFSGGGEGEGGRKGDRERDIDFDFLLLGQFKRLCFRYILPKQSSLKYYVAFSL